MAGKQGAQVFDEGTFRPALSKPRRLQRGFKKLNGRADCRASSVRDPDAAAPKVAKSRPKECRISTRRIGGASVPCALRVKRSRPNKISNTRILDLAAPGRLVSEIGSEIAMFFTTGTMSVENPFDDRTSNSLARSLPVCL